MSDKVIPVFKIALQFYIVAKLTRYFKNSYLDSYLCLFHCVSITLGQAL